MTQRKILSSHFVREQQKVEKLSEEELWKPWGTCVIRGDAPDHRTRARRGKETVRKNSQRNGSAKSFGCKEKSGRGPANFTASKGAARPCAEIRAVFRECFQVPRLYRCCLVVLECASLKVSLTIRLHLSSCDTSTVIQRNFTDRRPCLF